MSTEIISFENMTWPQVAELPRNIPLVIPLGEGYNLDSLFSALDAPSQIGMLPSIPYGWRGSGLAVPEELLGKYLANLLDSLRDDGFSRVYALTPQELGLGLGEKRIALPHATQSQPASLLPGDEERGKVVLIPIGHTEQHGFHLPLSTDTLIIDAICEKAEQAVAGLAVSLPAFPYGVSTHRASFAGTLNAGGRAFEDFWIAVVDVLANRGFDKFYFNSGHGGNCSFLVNVVKYSGERHRRIFCATAWLHTSGPLGVQALEQHRSSPLGGMGHACELETSMILHLRPDLARMELVVDEMDFIATPSYYMDWVEGGSLVANPPWDDDTRTGAYGAGSLATAEKGKIWLNAAAAEKAAHVVEIHEQQHRREERRKAGYGLWGKSEN